MANGKVIKWRSPAFIHHEKDFKWFLTMGIGALVIIGIALWLKYWLMAIAMVLATVAFFQYSRLKPEEKDYQISEEGIRISERLWPFSELRSFWVVGSDDHLILNLQPLGVKPPLSILLPREVAEEAISFLASYLPQEEREEGVIDKFLRLIKY